MERQMEFMDAVRARRSVRRFASKPVPAEVLTEILEAGRLAPSSGGVSSTYFGVVTDERMRLALAAAAGGQDWIATAPVVIALCTRLNPDPATMAEDDLFLKVNVARFGEGLVDYLNAYEDRRAVRVFWDNGAPMMPGEHLALAAASHGLGSCWIGHLDIRRTGEILNLPEDLVCLFLLPIGYPDEAPAEKTLRSLGACSFTNAWADTS